MWVGGRCTCTWAHMHACIEAMLLFYLPDEVNNICLWTNSIFCNAFCLSKSPVRLLMAIYNWFFSFSFFSLTQLSTKMTFLHPLGLSWVLVFFDTKDVALLDHRFPSLFRPWVLISVPYLFPTFSHKSQNLTLKIKEAQTLWGLRGQWVDTNSSVFCVLTL